MNEIDLEQFFNSKLFPKKDFIISRGEGALLFDSNGKKYIDCVAGHGVMNIGHSHPKFINAVKKQLEHLILIPQSYPHEAREKLLKRLADITPANLNQTFLSNSGTEAIEAALKLVLCSHRGKKNPEIIAFKKSFHGRTMGSLAMTFNMKYRKPFLPWLSNNVKFASYNDINSVKNKISDNTVAIFIECCQGEGGVFPANPEFIKELNELCQENQILLVDDEVQTGFGRTGKLFAYEHYNIIPDIICMAKGIAGGLPMGATISSEELYNKMMIGEHNTTFGGGPLVCAAANAVIDIIFEENLIENSVKQGEKIIKFLTILALEKKVIREIRGIGLMIGIDCRVKVKNLIKKAEEQGVLLLNAGISTLRLLPPLIINDEQTNQVLDVLNQIIS